MGFVPLFLVVSFLLLFFVFFYLDKWGFRTPNCCREFGPEVTNLELRVLDRNANGKNDTLEITYQIHSEKEIIAFGGTRLCIGNEYKRFACKSVSFNFENSCGDGEGHEVIKKGITECTRYIYFDKPFDEKIATVVELQMFGANETILFRRFDLKNGFKLMNFETLPIGDPLIKDHSDNSSYPDYRILESPLITE